MPGRISRRQFLRNSALMGLGSAAYGLLLAGTPRAVTSALLTPTPTPAATDEPTGDRPAPLDLGGAITDVHDPCIIKEGDTYYVFCTGIGIGARSSPDMRQWTLLDDVFPIVPNWAYRTILGARNMWAPDISFYNGLYHLYYAVSLFGLNRSVIGLATNHTLNPDSPDFAWEDRGLVIESQISDPWNAIDPNLVIDADGQPWLSFGSFWSGIKMRRIDPATGMLDPDDGELYALANRNLQPGDVGAIEAPFIIRHGDFYYLFVSFDFCCRGADSTYRIMVGRSEQVTGPYADREGVAMMEGGGTEVLAGNARWRGPGHNAVLQEEGRDWLVYHSYDAQGAGVPTLRISPITWDNDDWPQVSLDE